MTVLVTGGTGFTGRRVVRRLVASGRRVRCLVRKGSARDVLQGVPVEFRVGDLLDHAGVRSALDGCDTLVHVASLGFGWGPGVVRAAEQAGVRRGVFFSTTAVFTTIQARSRAVRVQAEESIRRSALEWTILRPTMIYGAAGDRNVERLFSALSRWRILPMVGRGSHRIQPVFVEDLAEAVVRVLDHDDSIRRSYCLAGGSAVDFAGFVREAARAAGRRVRLVPIPERLALLLARVWERVPCPPRIREEQVLRLLEDKDFDTRGAEDDFGWTPVRVEEGLAREAEALGRDRAR